MKSADNLPFVKLGGRLKELRHKVQESVDEVSGAVEIDRATLEQYESGSDRPSEDVLMLLINHFGVNDDDAVSLWQLAGYDKNSAKKKTTNNLQFEDEMQARSVMIMMTLDSRILYSDNVQINANNQGITFSFLQNGVANNDQQVPVARVGMSYDQAHEFMHLLNQTLSRIAALKQPKGLQEPKLNPEQDKKDGQN